MFSLKLQVPLIRISLSLKSFHSEWMSVTFSNKVLGLIFKLFSISIDRAETFLWDTHFIWKKSLLRAMSIPLSKLILILFASDASWKAISFRPRKCKASVRNFIIWWNDFWQLRWLNFDDGLCSTFSFVTFKLIWVADKWVFYSKLFFWHSE